MLVPYSTLFRSLVGLALFESDSAGFCCAVTVADVGGEVVPLPEEIGRASCRERALSAWVVVCVEVKLVNAPGASGPLPQGLIVPCLSSLMLNGPASVTFPVLVIV